MIGRIQGLGRAVVAVILPVVLTGCPEIGRMTYRFDVSTGKGTLSLEDIGTDDPDNAARDFASLVNDYVLGTKVQDDHPAWRVGERRLFESAGPLAGVASFSFTRPSDVGLYQFDKKSAYIWCADSSETVVSTSGEVIPPYPNCVAFDRKTRVFEVTVTTASGLGARQSLLPQFQGWDGQAIATDEPDLGDMSSLFGDAFRQALGGDPAAGDGGLGSLLPPVEVGSDWAALGLPVAGSQVVYTTDSSYSANHSGAAPADVLAQYGQVLAAAGYVAEGAAGADTAVWAKDGRRITVTAIQAGSSVIVSLSR
ncbi:MAG: hypothetical protein ABMB14_27040 [Myxococcota bacterium]